MKNTTRVNHPPTVDVPADNRPLSMPIYQSVKFEFDTVEETVRAFRGERDGFFYSRVGNPTIRQLELLLAELQGREDCVTTASGVNAINQTLLSLCRSGDHILCFYETYNPTRTCIKRLLARYGVEHTMLSVEDLPGIERVLASRPTRLVVFESPTNPMTKIADIGAITTLARRHGAVTVLDNTFAGFHQHGQFDIDYFVHSLTKYAAGTGDVMGGAVIANRDLLRELRPDFGLLGAALDPHAAFLLMRGMKTYFIRYRTQCAAALQVAQMLREHPAASQVRYPGLAGHPQAALVRAQMQDHGTVVTFDLRAGAEAGRFFAERLQLFAMTASLGSTESLVMPPQLLKASDFTPAERELAGFAEGSVRLSIGLEDIDDLLADLRQALSAIA